MGALLSLIFFASIVGIWYFWKKKPNKTYLISSIIALVLSTFLYSFTSEYKNDEKNVIKNLAHQSRKRLNLKKVMPYLTELLN